MVDHKRRGFLRTSAIAALAAPFATTRSFAANSTKFRLKFADVQPASHFTNIAAGWMADELEKQTNGQVTMKIFPGGALGGDDAVLTAMRSGAVDLGWVSTGQLSRTYPQFNLFSTSYLIGSHKQYEKIAHTDSQVYKMMADIIESKPNGISMVGIMGGPARCLYNKGKSIKTPEDLDGLRLRIQNSPIEAKVWSLLGAKPVPLPWTEIYTGLQAGVIEGAESSVDAYYSNKFYEIANHLSLTNHQYTVLPVLLSKKTASSMPPELLKIVQKVASEASVKSWELGWKGERELIKGKLAAGGVTVVQPDIALFQKKVAPLLSEVAKQYNAIDVLKAINAAA